MAAAAGARRAMYMGTGGFHFASRIDGNYHTTRIDGRVLVANIDRRRNITPVTRNRGVGAPVQGTAHDNYMKCTQCKTWKKCECFNNHAVSSVDRHLVGHNIKCRKCQTVQYTKHGYKKETAFITDSDEDSNYTDSDEDCDYKDSDDKDSLCMHCGKKCYDLC